MNQGYADNVESKEDEVCFTPNSFDPYWPDLGNDNRTNGAATCSDAEAFRTDVIGKDLGSIDPGRRPIT